MMGSTRRSSTRPSSARARAFSNPRRTGSCCSPRRLRSSSSGCTRPPPTTSTFSRRATRWPPTARTCSRSWGRRAVASSWPAPTALCTSSLTAIARAGSTPTRSAPSATAHASETWRCSTSVQWCTTPRTPSSIWCTMPSAHCCTRSRVRRRCSSSTLAGTARALCGSSRVSRPRSSLPTSDPRAKCATRPSTRRWIRTSRRASRTKKGRPPSWRSRRSRRRSPSNFSS